MRSRGVVGLWSHSISGSTPRGSPCRLTSIRRKGHESGHKVFIATLDVDKVFEQLQAYAVERALLDHEALAWAIAAVLRWLVDQIAWPTLDRVSCETPVRTWFHEFNAKEKRAKNMQRRSSVKVETVPAGFHRSLVEHVRRWWPGA